MVQVFRAGTMSLLSVVFPWSRIIKAYIKRLNFKKPNETIIVYLVITSTFKNL